MYNIYNELKKTNGKLNIERILKIWMTIYY